MIRFISIFLTLLCITAYSSAQDNAPQRLDDITLRHQSTMHSRYNGNVGGYSVIWTSSGFGRINFDDTNRPPIFELGTELTPVKYVWFSITNPSNGRMDDYWFCTQDIWNQYITNNDVEILRSSSWHFVHYLVSSSYEFPKQGEPITWVENSEHLWTGYTSDNTFIVVRLNDSSGQWEWTIRGTNGIESWTNSPSVEAAKIAAEQTVSP